MNNYLIEPTATQGEYRVVGQDSTLPIPVYYGTYDECKKYVNKRTTPELIEQKTASTLETIGSFTDWLKENHEIEIPEELIVNYLEQ